ncbi:MAG: FAD-dependent oxidoreductase, partial [Geminicoccaceae bacterium]
MADASSRSSADVVIVGSGVAGAIVALELAKAGIDTMMLEAGPRLQRWQIVERFRSSPTKGDSQAPYPPSPHAPHPQYSPPNDYVIQKGRDPFIAGYIRAVGGTTLHWNAVAARFLPSDFKLQSKYGVGRDWPLSYDDLEPDYYRAEVEMGVAGNLADDHGSPRRDPFPMDVAPLMSYLDLRVQQVLGEKGWKVVPDIVARNSRAYDGRPACVGNNTCAPICPIGAQYSGADTVRKAEAAGATLVTDAVVHRVELGPDGRVAAVRYLDPQGTEHRVTGRYFVLAANGIEIPKLLLMSDGVANSSDHVGRNLMDHPGSSITFLSSEPLWSGRGPQRNSFIEGMRDGAFRSEYAAAKMNVGNYNRIRQVTEELIERGVYGAALGE